MFAIPLLFAASICSNPPAGFEVRAVDGKSRSGGLASLGADGSLVLDGGEKIAAGEWYSLMTLVTPSRYVNRGLTYGLDEWRANGWQWEHFGEMVPVKNRDLWQRVDHALTYHELNCRTWRFDLPHFAPDNLPAALPEKPVAPLRLHDNRRFRLRRRLVVIERRLWERLAAWRLWLGQCGTRLLPLPWLE